MAFLGDGGAFVNGDDAGGAGHVAYGGGAETSHDRGDAGDDDGILH